MASDIERPDLNRVQGMLESTEKDREDGVGRQKPMKVLCLGMGRTGTTSLAAALKQLGFTPYDFIDRFYREHFHLWDDAIKAKYHSEGTPWERAEFDQVTGDFDALLDIPCCLFVDELVAAYPEAKVVLNVRDDPDKWLVSMNKTLFTVFRWPSWKLLQYTEPRLCGRWFKHVNLIWQVFCDGDRGEPCKQRYLEHNEKVRRSTDPSKLLEYRVSEGWEPLCQFLELPVPASSFPTGNTPDEFIDTHKQLWKVAIYMSTRRVLKYVVPMVAVAVAVWEWMPGRLS